MDVTFEDDDELEESPMSNKKEQVISKSPARIVVEKMNMSQPKNEEFYISNIHVAGTIMTPKLENIEEL